MAELTLYLPGLIGPFLRFPDEPLASLPALYRLLIHAKRRRITARSYTHRLAELFDLSNDKPLPAAAITRLVDETSRPEGYWLRADPIYLELKDTDYVVHSGERLALSQQDALILASIIQPLFQEHSLQLEVPHPGRWYVRLNKACNTIFHPIDCVNGITPGDYYPQGEQGRIFRSLFEDIQSVLEESELNQQRQEQGKQSINGVWFWGAGILPDVLIRQWSRVYNDDPLVKGLCLLSATEDKNLDEYDKLMQEIQPGEKVLLIDSRLDGLEKHQRYYDWQQQLQLLEELYLDRFLPALRHTAVQSITLIDNHYSFQLHASDLYKLWRRWTPLPSFFKKLSLS